MGATDELRDELRRRARKARRRVELAARLVAPVVDPKSWVKGYDWVIEQLRHDWPTVASELEMSKALAHLRDRDVEQATTELRAFERKDRLLQARAFVNLSFLYYLEGDMKQASLYAERAARTDRYNARALVNRGITLCEEGDVHHAKELFLEAIGVEADCAEAIFNLGLVNERLGAYQDALQAFEKLHTLVPSSPEVMFHIAHLHDVLGNPRLAVRHFADLLTKVPSDPHAMAQLALVHHKASEEAQALHYYRESYRVSPVDFDVIKFLATAAVDEERFGAAAELFAQAAALQPHKVQWRLMEASCHRRGDNTGKALRLLEETHEAFPHSVEALEFLIQLKEGLGHATAELKDKYDRLVAARDRSHLRGGGYDDEDDLSDDDDSAALSGALSASGAFSPGAGGRSPVRGGGGFLASPDDGRARDARAAPEPEGPSAAPAPAPAFAAPSGAGHTAGDWSGAGEGEGKDDDPFSDDDVTDGLL